MKHHAAFVTLACALTCAAMRAQETAVTGAQLTVVEKPAAQLEVTIEDRRESALVEWELRRRVRPGA